VGAPHRHPDLRSDVVVGSRLVSLWRLRPRASGTGRVLLYRVGSIPILLANWSRTLWPRLAVTVALVAVQLITGSIFMLAPRAA
jgi:hypothetical protein